MSRYAHPTPLLPSPSFNKILIDAAIELQTLQSIESPSSVDAIKLQLLERQIEITLQNKDFYKYSLAIIAAVGFHLMYYGFRKWHREIQPIQDEIARLQRDKLKIEIAALNTPSASHTVTSMTEPPAAGEK